MMGERHHDARFNGLISLLLFLAALGFYASTFNRGMMLADEGNLVHAAQRVAQGEVPYRDFYHFYAPGSFYIVAGLFKVFGESFLLTRVMWVAVRAAIVLLIFLVGLRFMPRRYAILPALVVLFVPGPWFKSFYPFSALLSLWTVLRYVESRRPANMAAASAAVAVSLLLRQDVGLETGLTLALAVLLSPLLEPRGAARWKRMFVHGVLGLAVVAAMLAPVILYFHFQHALGAMGQQLFGLAPSYTLSKWTVAVRKFAAEGGYPFQKLFFGAAPIVLLTGAVAAVARMVRCATSRDNLLFALLVVAAGLTLLPAYLPMAPIRFFQCSPAIWILAVVLLFQGSEKIMTVFTRTARAAWAARSLAAFLYLLAAGLCAAYTLNVLVARHEGLATTDYSGTITAAMRNSKPFEFRGETVYLAPKKGRELTRLVRYIRTHTADGEPIIVFPNQALLYYLCDRPNKTRFIGTFTLKYPDKAEDQSIWKESFNEARRLSPRYIIVHRKFLDSATRHAFRKLTNQYYAEDAQFGELVVMVKTDGKAKEKTGKKRREP